MVNGTTNAYRNPVDGSPMGTRHDRKLAFHSQLLAESKKLERQGFKLVLAGDFNIAPARIDGHPNLRTRPNSTSETEQTFMQSFLMTCPVA